MSWTSRALGLAAACFVLACSTQPPSWVAGERFSHPVSVTEAVHLSQAGVDPEVIVTKMNLSGIVYNLTDEQYEKIRGHGVTPRVIDYMRSTYDQAIARWPRLADDEYLACWYLGWDGAWYGGGPQGFHPACREP
ncbi:MAG: hypothetical protein QNK05_06075 [Myxococcota bacterium]|nr:hypothetical protein [Myxococcota bacterium]